MGQMFIFLFISLIFGNKVFIQIEDKNLGNFIKKNAHLQYENKILNNFHVFKSSNTKIETNAAKWSKKQKMKKLFTRNPFWNGNTFEFPDPLFSQQWHLINKNGPDLNVKEVWKQDITGKGIVVAIIDDGLDYTHPDLQENYVNGFNF